jgi:CMP-N-acetylneuraminic acid synthetase
MNMLQEQTIAFIPARGGSKRMPRKNLRMFAGHPLIAHSIAVGMSSPRIGRCVVSTDDDEIAAVAEAYGATVIERPQALSTDEAPTATAARHVVDSLIEAGVRPAVLVTLQPTCPLRPPYLVAEALDAFESRSADSVVSVTHSALKLGRVENGWFAPAYQIGIRSQDMSPAYFENGVIYVSRVDTLVAQGNLFGERVVALETDPLYAMADIDTELDFAIAEFLYFRHRDRFIDVVNPDARRASTRDPVMSTASSNRLS